MSSFFRIDKTLLRNQEANIDKIDAVATPGLKDVIGEILETSAAGKQADKETEEERLLEKINAQLRKKQKELAEAQQEILKAKEQSKAILTQAEEEAEKRKEAAEQAGYKDGRARAEKELEEEKRELEKKAECAVEAMTRAKETIFHEVEESVLDLSLCIAKKVIKKEIEDDSGIYLNIVKDLLTKVKDCSEITLKTNKKEYDAFFASDQEQFASLLKSSGVLIKPDLSVQSGECVVETEFGTIRSGIQTQLGLLENDLRGAETG